MSKVGGLPRRLGEGERQATKKGHGSAPRPAPKSRCKGAGDHRQSQARSSVRPASESQGVPGLG